ncbi:acyl-CoA thioesterase [Planococcus salinus]|uniref:Acyl-CoA thioesterase n=1 Tax=Planococcus salinus TaxID=1848460 RepID=A0A3M8PB99_9BACL|nr:thioesterase family protein [Planococcus salinus]RNF40903.1 acyl-CoA thioesterase [Planococcus salinus]
MKAKYIGDFEEWKNGFSFSVPVQVRFSETDLFGHLNNTVPLNYFEFARIEYMKELGVMQNWLTSEAELFPVVADAQIDYLKQVFFDDKLQIFVKIESIGNSSIDIHYWAVNDKKETCFTGRGAMVQISKKTGKGYPWSEEERRLFESTQSASVKS